MVLSGSTKRDKLISYKEKKTWYVRKLVMLRLRCDRQYLLFLIYVRAYKESINAWYLCSFQWKLRVVCFLVWLIKIWETTTIQNLILFWNSQAESISLVNMMLWSWKLKSLERTELVDLKEYYVMYGILGYPWVSSQMEIYLIKTS